MQKKRVIYKSDLPSLTQQHMKNECNINHILEKYRKTGMITHTSSREPKYGDFSQMQDFKSNLDMVRSAGDLFNNLPAQVRKRFGNDPEQLIEFCSDPSNLDEAIKLGLVDKKPEIQQQGKNDDKTTNNSPETPPA